MDWNGKMYLWQLDKVLDDDTGFWLDYNASECSEYYANKYDIKMRHLKCEVMDISVRGGSLYIVIDGER